MNFKRILVLVMALVMMVSACAPAIHAASDAVAHEHSHSSKTDAKKELNYVSIGDSMTNGLAMDGYDAKGNNGFLELAPEAYPAQIAAWLAGLKDTANYQENGTKFVFDGPNAKVSLTQLATSAARAEDALYMLQVNPELLKNLPDSAFDSPYNFNDFGADLGYTVDYWTINELVNNGNRWGHRADGYTKGEWAAEVATIFQSSIKDADVISLAVGNSNFGVYMTNRIMNIVGFGSAEELAHDRDVYGYMTFDNAVELCADNEDVKALVYKVYNAVMDELAAKGLPEEMIVELCDRISYTTASFLVSYTDLIVLINEMNPDAEVVIVPLINNIREFNFTVNYNGKNISIDLGDILDLLYIPVNAYVAALPAAMQLQDGYKDGKYYYAELPVGKNGAEVLVETYAQAFDELYAPVVAGEEYPASRWFCHDRFIGDIRGFVFPILLGDTGVEFNADDVKAYEIAKSEGMASFIAYASANADKAQWIAYYLGVVDAVLTAMTSTPEVDVNAFAGAGDAGMLGVLAPLTSTLPAEIETSIANKITAGSPNLVETIMNQVILPQIRAELEAQYGPLDDATFAYLLETTPELIAIIDEYKQVAINLATLMVLSDTISEELSEVGLLQALLSLYGRLKLAWGISAHPSAAGHDTLAESIINCIENDYTVKDETLANIDRIVKLIEKSYEKGYAYADAHGYTNKVVSVINRAINRIERVDLSDNRMTSAFRVKLQAELDATVATLEELKAAVENDDAKTVAGLKATILALKDDVKTHLKNIYGLCKQAGIDFINLPEVQEVIGQVEALVGIIAEFMADDFPYLLGCADMIIKTLITNTNDLGTIIYDMIMDRVEATTNGNYELTPDSAYVAIGNAKYAAQLAEMLHLSDKFAQFGINGDYHDAIANADLITIKVNNGEFYSFAYTQLMGTVANIIRSNSDLMGWCDNKLVGEEVRATIASYGIDLGAHTIELEWDNYLTEGQKALLDEFLARVKEQVLANGIPESIEYDLTPEIVSILEEKGMMLPGVSVTIEPLVINTADLVVYAVENLIYSYVQFVERTTNLILDIRAIAPNATVAITHIANPLASLPMDMIINYVPEVATYTQIVDGVVDALNGYLYALAFIDDNTIFVNSEDAEAIYGALNVFCKHYYDDCLDTECNVCFEKRTAPGHKFQYVYNNDATCTERGTETGKCANCDAVDTRATGKALGHDWKDATCTTAQTCNRCGKVGKAALGHKYDNNCDKECNVCHATRVTSHKFTDWKVIEPATHISDGLRQRTCMYCGYVETEPFSAIKEEVNIVAIVALAVGSLIVAFGGATAIILLIQKKKEQ